MVHTRAEHDQNVREGRHTHPPGERVSDTTLWFGALLGPAAWAAALVASYPLTGRGCGTAAVVGLVAITVAATVAAAVGFVLARRARDRLAPRHTDGSREAGSEPEGPPEQPAPHTAGPASTVGRQRLMAHGGMILSALMVAIMLGHGVALLVLGPCR